MARELQYEKGLIGYLFERYADISREVLKVRTNRIHEQMEEVAKVHGIEIVKIDIGNSLLEPAQKIFKKMQPTIDDDLLVVIFKQQAYGNCWNFNSKEKKIQRKIRRVYHYTCYHFDKDFGLGSHTMNTYLPNNVRGYFNQHYWIEQKLNHLGLYNDDIKMYFNSFQDIGNIDPVKFQTLCDSLTYTDIHHYDRKWILILWPELRDLYYRSYINEAEFCSNIIFKQKAFLNKFYINHCLTSYDQGRPENLSLIFKRGIDRRYRNPFKTKLRIVETNPSLKIQYKSQQHKQYIKLNDLRGETTTNNPRDIGLKKQDFKGIREASRGINERAMSIKQPISIDWINRHFDHNPFEGIMVGKKWIPGIKINDEKMISILKALSQQNVLGISMNDTTDFVNQDLGKFFEVPFKMSQISYVVRKLRGHGIVEKLTRRNRYRLTPLGHCLSRMLLLLTEKVILPFTWNAKKLCSNSTHLNRNHQSIDIKSDFLKKLNNIYSSIDKNLYKLLNLLDINIYLSVSSTT